MNRPRCHVTMYSQNLSLRAGPVGKLARFSPMLWVNSPNRLLPSKADTPMFDGMNHPAVPTMSARGSLFNHLYPSEAARTTTAPEREAPILRGLEAEILPDPAKNPASNRDEDVSHFTHTRINTVHTYLSVENCPNSA